MATECTQEAVLEFLLEKGGRVKNKELIDHFKVFLSSERTKRTLLRETFQRFVDNIAYVKSENGEKFVCLRRKYRDPEARTGYSDDGECNGNGPASKESSTSTLTADGNGILSGLEAKNQASDNETNFSSQQGTGVELCISDIALVEAEAESDGIRAIACPPAHSAVKLESVPSEVEVVESAAGKGVTPSQVIRRRTSRGSQRSLLALSEEGVGEGQSDALTGDGNTPKSSRKNFIELMMSSSPQVRRTLVHRNSQGNISFRKRDSVKSDSDSASLLSSVDEDCASVTLDPLEHEWMMCTSEGQWESLQRLLACDPSLVTKRDFVTGFTCLHWAAKQGKHELFALLVNYAKQNGISINVNARSSAGYTPLHLAAMHNHVEVMKLLIGAYDADVEMRDYNGKKASQYLSNSVTGDIKDIVGACGDSDTENGSCDSGGQAKPKSLYRKSSIGRIKPRLHKTRFKTQIVHSTSFRETEEGDEALKSPVKTRPMSNLFA
ncbi:ankyrin repeat domain-containing protein SOWAHC [Chanos chanos]|uniref:Ankyrin repeat domain-containing protein SOWAHC n=1 Tax=Chanos chanos TaxID=29144 RepID=A0A6J2WDW9_CHACN|nr:ankyrin repeat domain-containing protein SOWAHC [Chanos chanos]